MLTTLSELLAPVSRFEFLEVFRERKRLHIAASDPTRAETLFSWREIDTLVSGHGLDQNVIVMRDGVIVPREMYTSNKDSRLNVRALHDLLAQGVSIVVNGVNRLIPQIGQLAAAIEREMGIDTRVNAYLSFSKGGAFKPHWDGHDVLVLQVHGNKQWRIWKTEVPYPLEAEGIPNRAAKMVDVREPPDQVIEFAPGDVLFIPRGEPHCAAVSAGRSVHLTIGLGTRTGIDFLERLQVAAVQDPILRMDLPRHSSAEQSRAHEAALKDALHRLIDAASMSRFLQDDDISRSPALQTAVTGALPQTGDVLRLTLRRRVPLPEVEPDGGPQHVTIGGEARRLSPASIEILRWLFDHDPATWGELHAALTMRHGNDSIAAATRDLLRFGFLAVNRRCCTFAAQR
jgi:ribosomal protein L16 Arg81 hydroxylase